MPVKKNISQTVTSFNTKSLSGCSINSISNLSISMGVTIRSPIWSVLVCHCAVGCLLANLGWLILPGLTIGLWGHLILTCGSIQTRHEWRNLQFCLVHPCSLLKLLQSSLHSGSSLYVCGWGMTVSIHYRTLKHIFPTGVAFVASMGQKPLR